MTPDGRMKEPVVMRLPTLTRVYVVSFCFLSVGILVGSIINSPSDALPALLMTAAVGAFTFRIASLKLVADDAGLLIRNFYRTWRLRWADVEDFRTGSGGVAMPFGKVLHVLLLNGDVISVDVSARPWFGARGRERLERTMTGLRLWLPPRT